MIDRFRHVSQVYCDAFAQACDDALEHLGHLASLIFDTVPAVQRLGLGYYIPPDREEAMECEAIISLGQDWYIIAPCFDGVSIVDSTSMLHIPLPAGVVPSPLIVALCLYDAVEALDYRIARAIAGEAGEADRHFRSYDRVMIFERQRPSLSDAAPVLTLAHQCYLSAETGGFSGEALASLLQRLRGGTPHDVLCDEVRAQIAMTMLSTGR